jgi:transposase InsO family protein
LVSTGIRIHLHTLGHDPPSRACFHQRDNMHGWMLEYNEERPHDSLGDLTPIEFAITARNSSLELSP